MTLRFGIASRDWANYEEGDHSRELGGSGHYRCGLVAKVLQAMGVEVVLGTLTAHRYHGELGVKTWDDEHHWGFDVMLLQRWMFADLPARMRAARANGQILLNDIDDHWLGLDPANFAFRSSHPTTSAVENRDHYMQVLGASDLIVCSTPFLADRYRRFAPTVLVRNALDLDRWTAREPRDGPPVLGWVGALPWRSAGDIGALRGFLWPFMAKHDLTFHHAGALEQGWAFALEAGIPPWRLTQSPLVPISEHHTQFHNLDVTLIPLADKPFNHGKSFVKALQAAASGVPSIGSASPEHLWLRDERGMGRVAKNPKQWIQHLERLMDPNERRQDSLRNSASVQGFGLPTLAKDWAAILSSLPVHAGGGSLI